MNYYSKIFKMLAEGKSTGEDVHTTMDRLAHWREKARQNPRAKPGEPGYVRKAFPRNVNPDFPGEVKAQHARGERVIRRVIRGGEMERAHRDTEREARGDRHGIAHKYIPAGVRRKGVPRVDDRNPKGKYSDDDFRALPGGGEVPESEWIEVRGKPKSKFDNPVMGYDDSGKFTYPKGRKQARGAARAGAEQGAKRAREGPHQ